MGLLPVYVFQACTCKQLVRFQACTCKQLICFHACTRKNVGQGEHVNSSRKNNCSIIKKTPKTKKQMSTVIFKCISHALVIQCLHLVDTVHVRECVFTSGDRLNKEGRGVEREKTDIESRRKRLHIHEQPPTHSWEVGDERHHDDGHGSHKPLHGVVHRTSFHSIHSKLKHHTHTQTQASGLNRTASYPELEGAACEH